MPPFILPSRTHPPPLHTTLRAPIQSLVYATPRRHTTVRKFEMSCGYGSSVSCAVSPALKIESVCRCCSCVLVCVAEWVRIATTSVKTVKVGISTMHTRVFGNAKPCMHSRAYASFLPCVTVHARHTAWMHAFIVPSIHLDTWFFNHP